MDPSRNHALQDAKMHALNMSGSPSAPPSYHMVVDANAPIPNLRNSYDPESESDHNEIEDSIPEVNINATTQIRGHANIITVSPIDPTRLAGMLHSLLNGVPPEQASLPDSAPDGADGRSTRSLPRMNITITCGATVVGDRNIVGPGLGDIAKHMQMAQTRQGQAARQDVLQTRAPGQGHTQSQPQTATQAPNEAQPQIRSHVHLQSFHLPVPTPPMSRTPSQDAGNAAAVGAKRKADTDVDERSRKKQSNVDEA